MYSSFCVLQSQEQAEISVLRRMWKIEESTALVICVRFSSTSLCKITPSRIDDGKEEYSVHIHDLHLDYVRRTAGRTSSEWHRRLPHSHIPPRDCAGTSTTDDLIPKMLEHIPRRWWKNDIANKEYIRRNLCRHLQEGDLGLELGAVVLDLRWMHAQAHTGECLG